MVLRIALTGAPFAGKTRATESLVSLDRIFVLPEAAHLLYSCGFPSPEDVGLTYRQWVMRYRKNFVPARFAIQKALEDAWVGKAEYQGIRAVICDRSLADGLVYYWNASSFLREVSSTREEMHERYDGVIFFESAVIGATPRNYNRRMPIEWSRLAHTRLLKFWRNHKGFHYVKNHRHVEDKAAEVVEIVDAFLRQ